VSSAVDLAAANLRASAVRGPTDGLGAARWAFFAPVPGAMQEIGDLVEVGKVEKPVTKGCGVILPLS